MDPSVLDTCVLHKLFDGDSEFAAKAHRHVALYGHLYITIISYYEVMKGYKNMERFGKRKRREAKERQQRFQEFCYGNKVLLLDELSCRRAAKVYAHYRKINKYYQKGGDILIAGIALANGLAVVTDNRKHFREIAGLNVESW
jgi:predicted nucleic acid-binding protein